MPKLSYGYQNPLKIIYDTQSGSLEQLERQLGKNTVRQLEAMGFIKNAPSADGDTWKISARAEHLGKISFQRYTLRDRLKDIYRYKLPRLLFGV